MTKTNTPTLSKSEFKLASSCPQKLLYKKAKYPSANDENEFLQILAEGGYIVGKMAQVMYEQYAKENGYVCKEITADRKSQEAITETEELLFSHDKIILFEPAISIGQKIIRIDVLVKTGNHFEIIEVKAKSHTGTTDEDGKDGKSTQEKKLKEYIEDVAYQTLVLEKFLENNKDKFPNTSIKSFLFTPDKSKHTQIENLAAWFEISSRIKIGDFNSIVVDFLQTGKEKDLWENGNSILQKLDVNDKVREMLPEIKKRTALFLSYLNKENKINTEALISKDCFKCEYKNPNDKSKDGYYQCLGARAYADNHISELYRGGEIGGKKNPLVNEKLKDNKALSIFDFDESDFVTTKGEVGSINERQIIQYKNTKNNTEYISDNLKNELEALEYPLYFIDFETITCAIPHHKGMRPYETVAFQWSCHTVESPNAAPTHAEWINDETNFPNFRFAESLMQHIGNNGTPLMWATHENKVLRTILEQLRNANQYVEGYSNEKLKQWLFDITKESDKKGKIPRPGRLVDMNALTLKHYFHPYMKGKTSIKKTLPAVWNYHNYLHEIPYFKPYYKQENGIILNPYETLKYHWENAEYDKAEINETVKEGSAAMRAYQDMLFGQGKNNPKIQQRLKKELLNYCELDTMAMVIIWHHWLNNTK
ncbi:MAG: DUF2779 domain-containing protein [Chitinophagales bacterium]